MEQIEEIWQRLNEGGHHPFRVRKDTQNDISKTFYLFLFPDTNSAER